MRFYIITILLLGCVGCKQIDTKYVTYRGKSINGIQIFIDMLKAEGQQVDTWPALGEHLYNDYDLVIIFHDDFSEPDEETFDFIDKFSYLSETQKVLFVGRDLDLTALYWRTISSQLAQGGDSEQAKKANELANDSHNDLKGSLSASYSIESGGEIFGVDAIGKKTRKISEVLTHAADGEDENEMIKLACNWELYRRLIPPEDAEVLWQTADDEPLLTLQAPDYFDLNLFALGSAYPLLNGALVQPENQQLVADLIQRLEPSGKIAVVSRSIVFNEAEEDAGMWRFLKVFPHPWIASHLLLFLGLFCLSRLPIFGRPRVEVFKDLKRFGSHVEALGDLMRRTGQSQFAKKRILEWKTRRSAGQKPGAK